MKRTARTQVALTIAGFTALLIEAVKQQRREIAELQAQLRKRTAKQARLESRLVQLEADR